MEWLKEGGGDGKGGGEGNRRGEEERKGGKREVVVISRLPSRIYLSISYSLHRKFSSYHHLPLLHDSRRLCSDSQGDRKRHWSQNTAFTTPPIPERHGILDLNPFSTGTYFYLGFWV
ncbi:hypothetical protein E2C01_076953 [Portunus trituberculatus]|uniref:Uncharacterized protein n=1 Tax=Portunus trituberculatus TaxID=210409 RepID=A0A5B7IJ10_PORTR|nr:hypothetical protein [Portunus trituberculatus]